MKEISDESYELVTYTDNEADLYRQRKLPIIANLTRKKAQGRYDRELAAKAFMYLADAGAKKHSREFRSSVPWNVAFPISARREAAQFWAKEFEVEHKLGNYDRYIPAKYQPKTTKTRRSSRRA